MKDKLDIDVFCSDEVYGSEKFKLILNIKNLSDQQIIIKDIREVLAPGKIIYYDTSSTHLDLDNLDIYRKNIYYEMWMQIIDASRIILRKEYPIKYFTVHLLKNINMFPFNYLSRFISFKDIYKEISPHEFYINSFYLMNDEQAKRLRQDYIDKLNDNSEIKKAFYRNEEELKRVNEKIEKLEKDNGRKYGKIIESNQYLKIPIEFLCKYNWKYSKESFTMNITFEDAEGQINTVSKEINLNIKPSKKTVFWGAFLGVSISMILINSTIVGGTGFNLLYSAFINTNFVINIILAFLLSCVTYDNSQKTPIRAEGISGGFVIGVLSVIGKDKLLEIFSAL